MCYTTSMYARRRIVGGIDRLAQIALAIKDIDQVTRQTLVATHQSEQAAANLNLIGKQLAMVVGSTRVAPRWTSKNSSNA